jgi:hypothetical protein
MVYGYHHPSQRPGLAQRITQEAYNRGLYTPETVPFTSPENLCNLGRVYGRPECGQGDPNWDAGRERLANWLVQGQPVIVDIQWEASYSRGGEAHFVVVTGVRRDGAQVRVNDPLTYGNGGTVREMRGEMFDSMWSDNSDNVTRWWMVLP